METLTEESARIGRRAMVHAVTQISAQIRSLQAAVHDIRLTLTEHMRVAPSCEWRDTDATAHLHADSARRNHSSTLLYLEEIDADFTVNGRRALYAEGGDCELAGAEAWAFFNATHKLMRPKLVQGVLYACSGQPVMGKTGRQPDATDGITPVMQRYVLRGLESDGCIWEPAGDACSHGVMNVCGMRHRVALVHTLEGARVLVDWGVGQFSRLPLDIGLYVLHDDESGM